jgi:peptide/nickel transport system permease protein
MKKNKKKMTPKAFLKRYLRVMVSGAVLLFILGVAIFAPLIATHDPYESNIYNMNKLASAEHYFGTDCFGRDTFSRVVYGSRVSLSITLTVTTLSIIIGTVLGLICGYYKWADRILMRLLEGFNALPGILLSITLITILGNGVDKLIIAMVIVRLPSIARLVRQQVLSLKEKEFVECARACGASDTRIIFKHILPQCTSPLIIRFTSGLGGAILSQASLAFLGVGMDPRIPNWGGIINEGRAMVMAMPYQCAYAGVAIMITTLAFSSWVTVSATSWTPS